MKLTIAQITLLFLITNQINAYEIYPECRAEVYKNLMDSKSSPKLNWPSWVTQVYSTNCDQINNPGKVSAIDDALKLSLDIDKISKSLLDNVYTKKDTFRIRKLILECQNRVESIHKLAAVAASDVYDFKIPPGNKIVQKVEQNEKQNIYSGIKMYILAPIDEGPNNKLPIILSFAGTKDKKDAASDLGFGADHYEDARKFFREGTFVFNKLKQGKDLIITGHSLGGALAQAAAASLVDSVSKEQYVDKKFERGPSPENWGKIKLVTFNSFGGEKLKEYGDRHVGEQLDNQEFFKGLPAKNSKQNFIDRFYLQKMKEQLTETVLDQSVHYRVENDAVSRLGNHYGEVRQIKAVLPPIVSVLSKIEPLTKLGVIGHAHLMSTVQKSLDNQGFEKAKVEKEKEMGLGNWVTEITNKAYSDNIKDIPK